MRDIKKNYDFQKGESSKMSARDNILANLRATLARPAQRFPPQNPTPLTADRRMTVTNAEGNKDKLAQRFGTELERLHGTFQIVESAPEARLALVNQLLRWDEEETGMRKGAQMQTAQERHVLGWEPASLPVPAIQEALAALNFQLVTPSNLAAAQARDDIRYIRYGITGVEAAFASTGSILVAASAQTNRVASLLPFRHIALIPFAQLYPTMEAWLHERRTAGDLTDLYRDHANLTMISGPSKSADIENEFNAGGSWPQVCSCHFVWGVLNSNVT